MGHQSLDADHESDPNQGLLSPLVQSAEDEGRSDTDIVHLVTVVVTHGVGDDLIGVKVNEEKLMGGGHGMVEDTALVVGVTGPLKPGSLPELQGYGKVEVRVSSGPGHQGVRVELVLFVTVLAVNEPVSVLRPDVAVIVGSGRVRLGGRREVALSVGSGLVKLASGLDKVWLTPVAVKLTL